MKCIIYALLALTVCSGCVAPQRSTVKSIQLFNGKNLNGWHIDVPDMDKDPSLKSPFLVRNKELISMGKPGGHLITDSIYKDYTLEVEYRFVNTQGNCGVLVHASTPRILYKMFPKSI